MNIWSSIAGALEVELVSPEPEARLLAISQAGIRIYDLIFPDPLTARFRIGRRDWRPLLRYCGSKGDSLKPVRRLGVYWKAAAMKKRPVLLAGLAVLFALTLYLPGRILFIRVEGNQMIPERRILEAAEACGVRFGTVRRQLRSEKVKNSLLERIPQLQWAGVNTSGCTAVISVREREAGEQLPEAPGIHSIVAVRDGVITSCVVTQGSALCAVGQAVTRGQTLISPYTDCGIAIRVTDARGEIFAQTAHELRSVTPTRGRKRMTPGKTRRRFVLIIGKKRINFYKGSGICDTTCDRMYEEYYITLPGGFRLPVCVGIETLTLWETGEAPLQLPEQVFSEMAAAYLRSRMISGQILSERTYFQKGQDHLVLEGTYVCREMIGRESMEKIGE